jgi:hypothetical protein
MLALTAASMAACNRPAAVGRDAGSQPTAATAAVAEVHPPLSAASRSTIERFCGDCHRLPAPSSFPRDRWPAEVRRGYDFYRASGRTDLIRPVQRDAIRYFQSAAPESLPIPRAADRASRPAAVVFERVDLPAAFEATDPAVGGMLWRPTHRDLLVSDMRRGVVQRWRLSSPDRPVETVARIPHPGRIVPLGASDGVESFAVSDLGSFEPADHDRGGVWVLEESPEGFSSRPLHDGLGRTVEALPIDFDGVEPIDLLAADFGWITTGGLHVLVADAAGGHRRRSLDPRHGVVATTTADMDADGRIDIVAAFGQEHETVDIYWKNPDGAYEHALVHAFPDPSWGSSGIAIADIDGDGRPDILHANGDTLDSGLARPVHGIRWLRNRGDRSFELRDVGLMPGVCQATAVDCDGDGDLDIVAGSLHPGGDALRPGTLDSLAWFEQLADGSFAPHSIERDDCRHACFAIADIDGDGRPDLVAGTWLGEASGAMLPSAVVYRNRPAQP